MEKEVLVIVDLKEGKLEKFMGWMQSDEGMSVRKSAAHPEKTIVTILCDKSDKYNSKMFNKKFLEEKGLPFPSWI